MVDRNPSSTSTSAGVSSNAALQALTGARPDLRGKRYISLLRCSNLSQADTSPDDQRHVNDVFAGLQGMLWSGDDIYAEGVSGSQTFNRTDLAEILDRKRLRDDFDVVVIFEFGRMTRGGIRHGNVVEDQLGQVGVEVVSSTELIPPGPLGDLIKSIKHFSNQQQAFNISKSVARGLAASLQRGSRPAASRTPFGLDRLYVGPDGSERVRVRWVGDVQQRLDPKTGVEIGRAVRPPSRRPRKLDDVHRKPERRNRFIGYVKQADERSLLVEGSAEFKTLIIDMMRWYHCNDIGAHKIVKRLCARDSKSPGGGDWCLTSVLNIVTNPIYLGVEVRHRFTKSLYHQISPDGPVPVQVDQDELRRQGRVAVPLRERLRDEWVLTDKPGLREYLPPDVREAARTHITALLDVDTVRAKQAKVKKRKNKNDDSPYVLSHLLHSKQSLKPMRGDSPGKQARARRKEGKAATRYYFDSTTCAKAVSGLLARRVRAAELEDAVVPAVFEGLFDRSWIEREVGSHVKKLQSAGRRDPKAERDALKAEQQEITRRLARTHKMSGHLNDDDLAAIVADDNARLITIHRALGDLDRQVVSRLPTPEEAIAVVTEQIAQLPADWRDMPNAEMKTLLSAVITDLQIDLETFQTTFKIRLPEPSLAPSENGKASFSKQDHGRLNFRSPWRSEVGTTADSSIWLAKVACEHDRKARCYRCRRSRIAA